MADTWKAALTEHQRASEALSKDLRSSHDRFAETFEQRSASLVESVSTRLESTAGSVDPAHAKLQAEMASRDEQRLSAWTQSLAQAARDMSAQTEAHAKSTTAEIARLLQAASEAPRAAAEVVAELRQKLSDSMARDNTMLEERARILETLGTLLDAVNHASTEQRAAVDALVGASADVLDRIGSRFTEKVESETGKMADVAAQITGSAVEVASLGETFGFAVQLFSESNDKLVTHLQRIEGALGKSIARSDEQLEYYVAQAREVIDLSIMSQKQIVEDLQQIAGQRTPVGSEA